MLIKSLLVFEPSVLHRQQPRQSFLSPLPAHGGQVQLLTVFPLDSRALFRRLPHSRMPYCGPGTCIGLPRRSLLTRMFFRVPFLGRIVSDIGIRMEISSRELDRRMDRFKGIFRQSGIKLTHQRLEIFRELAKSGDHPDAETIFRGVRERLPMISLDTVYRTLWLLLDLGLVTTLGPSRVGTRFDANMSCHHHFVCSRCGMTQDFYSEEFDNLTVPESIKTYGEAQTTRVEVRGVCTKCVGKKKSQPANFKRKETKQ